MNEMDLFLIIRDGWNLGANILDRIYISSNIASLLDSCKLITGIIHKIIRPEKIVNVGLKARP